MLAAIHAEPPTTPANSGHAGPTVVTCRRGDPECTGGCVCGAACTTTPPTPATPPAVPRSGEILIIDGSASVQFATGAAAMLFRVIRVHEWSTCAGWIWLDGYQLDHAGTATERRSVYVQTAGLRRYAPVSPEPAETRSSARLRQPLAAPATTGRR